MRLSISNIAWDTVEDAAVLQTLQQFAVDAIDVAPSKYFPSLVQASDADIAGVRAWWADGGIEITGMQSLLYGTTGLNVFGSAEVQQAMLAHLDAVCRIGAGLGAPRLVFGSPKNRDRGGLSDADAMEMALPFFRRLGDIAQSHGVLICLEPNPERYGANFMRNSAETARVVTALAHPAVKMQLDSGALTVNGEDPEVAIATHATLIGHIHLSEPDLLPLGDGNTPHALVATALRRHLAGHVATIEMLAPKTEDHVQAIARALGVATREFRDEDRYTP